MAASVIGTNVVADEQQYIALMKKFFDTIEKAYLNNNEDRKRMKMLDELRLHTKVGGNLAYNAVPREFAKNVSMILDKEDIPYVMTPSDKGDMMFILRDKDASQFLEIQKTFYQMSTDYAKELTPQTIIDLHKTQGHREVDMLTFRDKNMANIAMQKLYQSGITFASRDIGDEVQVYISPMSKFSEKGEDLNNFELMHAFEQAKADDLLTKVLPKGEKSLLELRFKQADQDKREIEALYRSLEFGGSVMCCESGNQTLYLETKDGGVFVNEKQNGVWHEKKLDINPKCSLEEFSAVISKYTEQIKNMGVVYKEQFEKYDQMNNIDPKMAATGVFNKREKASLVKEPGGLSQANLLAESKDLERVLNAINREGTKRANARIGDKIVSQDKAYEIKKKAIIEIMDEKSLPEIKHYLTTEGRSGVSLDMKEKWLDNVFEHYKNPNEKGKFECVVGHIKTKELQAELRKEADIKREKEEEKLRNKENEKDKDLELEGELEIDKGNVSPVAGHSR